MQNTINELTKFLNLKSTFLITKLVVCDSIDTSTL